MTRRVVVELTVTEAWAVWSLANCSSDTYEDARAVLGTPQKVAAGRRGMQKIVRALRNGGR